MKTIGFFRRLSSECEKLSWPFSRAFNGCTGETPPAQSSSYGRDCAGPRSGTALAITTAFLVYASLSIVFFGIPIIGSLSKTYIGGGTDPICHIWAIAWWPHAIAHRINPLISHALWAPVGYNLVWGTDIPGPSLLIYPVTRFFGPVVSYNILCLLAPPAAAVSAFVLCLYTCQRFWPALLGGYVFGFSPYMLCHILAHLVLLVTFPVPLAVYVTQLRLDGRTGRLTFGASLIALLLVEFLSSTEIFATATVFGAVALIVSFMLGESESRRNLISISKEIAFAYLVLAILVAPYLYYVFVPGLPTAPSPKAIFSNDLLTFIFPPPVLLFGPHSASSSLRQFFKVAPWWEQSAYLGPGMYILMIMFARRYWRARVGKFLVASFAVIAMMSLGPFLHVGGKRVMVIPGRLLSKLPLINQALPGRFGLYLFLIAAVAAAIYLAQESVPLWTRAVLAGLSIVFIFPEVPIWQRIGQVPAFLGTPGQTKIYIPEFFGSAQYKGYLRPGENALFLPLGTGGSNLGMLWQAQTDFYFNTTDWFGAIPPPDAARWPIMAAFDSGREILDFSEQLKGFLGGHQVTAIVVNSKTPGRWPLMLSDMNMTPIATGGVLFYRVPPDVVDSFKTTTAHDMAAKYAAASFATLVIAASKYVNGGFPLAKLGPREAQRLKLLSLPDSKPRLGSPPSVWHNLWLDSRDGLINIGILGNYQDLNFLISDYGPDAVGIFFPFPKPISKRRQHGNGMLLITFTPQGIQRAARKARNPEVPDATKMSAPLRSNCCLEGARVRICATLRRRPPA